MIESGLCRQMMLKRKWAIYKMLYCSMRYEKVLMQILEPVRIGMEVCKIEYGKLPISTMFIRTINMENR